MECGETRELLAACHDGEIAPADRARVEEHLRGCAECSAIFERLALIDANVGVPDPGPEYWDRFNRRVMERVEGAEKGASEGSRPKRGWVRRQMPYFLPAVAAAALLFVVVRQTGVDPFSRTAAPPAAPAAQREEAAAPAATSIPQASARAVLRAPAPEKKREAPAALRDEAGRAPSRAIPAPSQESFRDAAPRQEAAVSENVSDRAAMKPAAAGLAATAPSPCEDARLLAGKGRLEEAEAAQRACLARENAPEAQEKDMLFLAELLDRQSRIADADAVLRDAERRFPGSRPLDEYLRQRPQVQGRRIP